MMWEVDNFTYNILAVAFLLFFWAWFFHLYYKYKEIKKKKEEEKNWEMYEDMWEMIG